MRRWLLGILFLMVVSPASAQVCGTLTNCPPASTPLSGTELLYLVQGGVSKKITVGAFGPQIFGQIPAMTVLANVTAQAAIPLAVPLSTFFALAPLFTSTTQGVVPASGGGTTNFLRADGTWAAPPGASTIANASGSNNSTTGTIGASSTSLALASAQDFVDGEGILVNHAGATFTGAQPTALAATITCQGVPGCVTTGAHSYAYQVSCVDNAGGVGTATAPVTLTGKNTLSVDVYITLTWTQGAGCSYYAVWKSVDGGAYQLMTMTPEFGAFHTYDDGGIPLPRSIFYIPATPPVADQPDWLVSTISAGAGTTSLTLADAATNAVSGATVRHDDTAAMLAYFNATSAAQVPPGIYNLTNIKVLTSLHSVACEGSGSTTFQIASGSDRDPSIGMHPAFLASGLTNFSMTGCSVISLAPMAIGGLEVVSSSDIKIDKNTLQGYYAAFSRSNLYVRITNNYIMPYYAAAALSYNDINSIIDGNIANQAYVFGSVGFWMRNPTIGTLTHNQVTGSTLFSYAASQGLQATINDNAGTDSQHECVVDNVPVSQVQGNTCVWRNNTSRDYAMSFDNDAGATTTSVMVTNNNIYSPANACADITSTYGTGTGGLNNFLYKHNLCVSPYTIDYSTIITEEDAIWVMGRLLSGVVIADNRVLKGVNSWNYTVAEVNDGVGNPLGQNVYYGNTGATGSNAFYKILSNAQGSGAGSFGKPITFSELPPCVASSEGFSAPISDSNTNTFNAAITASGSNHGIAYCSGAGGYVFH